MKPNDEIMQLVRDYFDGGFNCAESVLLAGAEVFEHQAANIPRLATPFGGGLSGNGYACGAITGALMVIGLCYGREEAVDLKRKRRACNLADRFLEAFIERFGSVSCNDLSGVDFKTHEGMRRYREHVHAEVCVPIVEFAAEWLAKNL